MKISALRSYCITTKQGPTRNLGSCTLTSERGLHRLRRPAPSTISLSQPQGPNPRWARTCSRSPQLETSVSLVYPKQNTHDCAVSRPGECSPQHWLPDGTATRCWVQLSSLEARKRQNSSSHPQQPPPTRQSFNIQQTTEWTNERTNDPTKTQPSSIFNNPISSHASWHVLLLL